jgi:hypothetical protein
MRASIPARLLLLAMVCLVAAACRGSGDDTGGAAPATTTAASGTTAAAASQACADAAALKASVAELDQLDLRRPVRCQIPARPPESCLVMAGGLPHLNTERPGSRIRPLTLRRLRPVRGAAIV